MQNRLLSVALLLFMAPPAIAQQPTLVVENGRVITGDGTVLEEASVVVAGDSILSVTQHPVEAPNARRIDATGKTVLPGLIDAHVHLTVPADARDSTALGQHLDERVPEILNGFLAHGVTTVRSTGGYWPWVGDLRDKLDKGEIRGPRMVTSGPVLTAEGGHPATTVCAGMYSGVTPGHTDPFCRSHLAREVEGPDEAREAVRRLADGGVDQIKLVSDTTSPPDPVQIRTETVEAVVDQAHQEGLEAVGHVFEADLMETYARVGMDGFVHLPFFFEEPPDRLARVLAEQDTPVTSTLAVVLLFTTEPAGPVFEGEDPRRERIESWAEKAAILAEAGVPIVLGTDWCDCVAGEHPAIQPGAVTITEMQMLQWGGMSRQAIIHAATVNAARALEMGDQVGTLEAGKLADLIVVDENPLEDLSALEDVEVVLRGGEIVRE